MSGDGRGWANVDARGLLRLLADEARPRGLQTLADARRFATSHGLPGSLRQHVVAYRRAVQYGMDILPPMPLNGLVVDVGANVGGFTDAVLRAEPRARVLAVEPGPKAGRLLRARFGSDPRVTIDTRAVASVAGTSELHVTHASVFSSLHPPLDDLTDRYDSGAAVAEVVTVETVPLDDLVREPVQLLKIDVQGAEAELLAGAQTTLANTAAVLLEVLFVAHYEREATFPELHQAMNDLGFDLAGLGEPYTSDGRVLWADACYLPRADQPASSQ